MGQARAADAKPPAVSSSLPAILDGRVHVLPAGAGTTVLLVEDHRAPLVYLRLFLAGGSESPFIKQHPAAAYEAFAWRSAMSEFARRTEDLAISISPVMWPRHTALYANFLKEDRVAATHLLRELLYDHKGTPRKKPRWQFDPGSLQAVQPPSQMLTVRAREMFCPAPRPAPAKAPAAKTLREEPFQNRDRQLRLPGRIIALAGDLSIAEAMDFVAQLGLPAIEAPSVVNSDAATRAAAAANPPREIPCRKPDTADIELARPKITQVYFSYSRVAPSRRDPDVMFLSVVQQVLNRRLFDDFQQTGDTYTIHATTYLAPQPGFYTISSYSVSERARHFEAKLKDYIRRFGETGITAEELDLALKSLRSARTMRMRHPSTILDEIVTDLMRGEPVGESYQDPSFFARLTLASVNDFIRRFFRPSDFVMVKLVPEKR